MPPNKRKPQKKKKPSPSRRASSQRVGAMKGGTAVAGSVYCADFVGRDQHNVTYGYTAEDVERLIEKVIAFLGAGAAFLPYGPQRESVRAELDGETLTFHPGAAKKLATGRSERSYLLSLTIRREYQVWATKFIPLAAQVDVRRAVEGLDMPVAYTEFIVPPPGAGLEAQPRTEPLADITQALDKHDAFVILGEPGAGKTTTLQKIAFDSALALLDGGRGRVPLFVRLSQQGGRTPFEFLQAEWHQHTRDDFADALATGRILLLADGLNELPRDDRAERLKAWRLFAADHAGADQLVFTGREKDYEGQLDLPRVRVEPLDDDRIADYVKRNNAEGLENLLDDPKTRLRDMARNPFNLSLLVFAYKSNQREMGNRGALLRWFTGELFAREERLAHKGWLPRDAQTRALAQLAYAMQAQGESTTLPVEAARAILPKTVEVDGDEAAVKPADLFRFARAATLLDPAVDPDIRFYHHLVQEYFAALELLRRFEAGEDLSPLWASKRLIEEMPPANVGDWDPLPEPPATGWEVTTILACGLAPDPARLIEAVRPHNPNLAGRCLDESGILQLQTSNLKLQIQLDLLAELYNPAIHLRARLQAGFTLGRIGDPRFEPTVINGVKVIIPQTVNVPAGTYTIGSPADDADAFDNEKPQHAVDLPAFAIGKWPVTNAEFACFMEAGGYKDEQWWKTELAKRWLKGEEVAGGQSKTWMDTWNLLKSTPNWKEQLERAGVYSPDQMKALEYIAGLTEDELNAWLSRSFSDKSREQPQYWNDAERNNPSQPVVGLTWFEANAYCEWLSAITGRAYRLPTEVEWEAAARGAEGLRYSWGNDWDVAKANTIEGRVLKPSPVGAYAAAGGLGPFGAEDQTGNVWDWTSTLYQPYPYNAKDGRENADAEGERVLRGGSWGDNLRDARCAFRGRNVPVDFNDDLGLRLFSPAL